MAKQNTSPALQSRANQLLLLLGRFWGWWTGELLGILPQSLREQFQGRGRYLLAELEDGRCSVRYGNRGSFKPVSSFELTDAWQISGEPPQGFTDLRGKADDTVLLLPSEMLLNKTLTLPAATESGLENVLRFEMDRHTPFTAEQVYFGYRVIERDKKSQKIRISLTLVPRSKLDPLFEQLGSIGLTPTVMAPAADASEELYSMNMLPRIMHSDRGRNRRAHRWQLLVILVLVVAAITLPVLQLEGRAEVLRTEVNLPKEQAEKAQAVTDEINLLKESRQFLINKKNSEPSALILLSDLTQLLPDNTWINRLELGDKELKLQGESGQASALIGLLEGSGYLTNVHFSSPVTSNPRNQRERFVIVAELREEAP